MKQILATLGLILLTLTAGGYLYKSGAASTIAHEGKIFERHFFKGTHHSAKLSAGEIPQVLSYRIKHHLNSNQLPQSEDQQTETKNTIIDAECDVQAIFKAEKNTFEIAVSYSKIDKNGDEHVDITQENIPSGARILADDEEANYINEKLSNTTDGEVLTGEKLMGAHETFTHQDRFFLAEVEADSGKLISLKGENGVEEDDHVNFMTQTLVNDILPELRKESYEQKVQEADNLGTVAVTFAHKQADDDNLHIHKSYTQDDFVESHIQHLNMPLINYNRNITVKQETGIAHLGNSTYKFQLGQKEEKLQATQDGEAQIGVEVLGQMHGHVKQDFELITSTENVEQLATEMMRYRTEGEFHPITLSHEHKASFEMGDGEYVDFQTEPFTADEHITDGEQTNFFAGEKSAQQQQVLKAEQREFLKAAPIYSHSHQLASVKVFGSHIHADLDYDVYQATSSLSVDTKVNNRLIMRLLSVSWKNCVTKPNNRNYSKKFTLFKATFPLLGIITIPVSASIKFDYGFNSGLTGGARNCVYNFDPYFKSSLYAQGQASILNIVSAGIYAQGTFLDAGLQFKIGSSYNKSYVQLDGQFRAFTLNIGATWTKFNCSPKRWFRRALEEVPSGQKRVLHWHHHHFHFHRVIHHITHAVHRVWHAVKHVAKVVRKVIPAVINTFCKRSQGYKQIYKKASRAYNRRLYYKSVNIGL